MKIDIEMSEVTSDGKGVQQVRTIKLEGTREDAAVLFDSLAQEFARYLPTKTGARVLPNLSGATDGVRS